MPLSGYKKIQQADKRELSPPDRRAREEAERIQAQVKEEFGDPSTRDLHIYTAFHPRLGSIKLVIPMKLKGLVEEILRTFDETKNLTHKSVIQSEKIRVANYLKQKEFAHSPNLKKALSWEILEETTTRDVKNIEPNAEFGYQGWSNLLFSQERLYEQNLAERPGKTTAPSR